MISAIAKYFYNRGLNRWETLEKKFILIKVYKNYRFWFFKKGDLAKHLHALQFKVRFGRGFEQAAFSLLERSLKPGNTVIDIGANIGIISLFVSKLVGDNGKVFSIEAIPETYDILNRNVEKNGITNISSYNFAVSEISGEVILNIPKYNNTLEDGDAFYSIDKDATVGTKIRSRTFDDFFFNDVNNHVDLIKIDIEGAELLCFKGARKLLSSSFAPLIIFEANNEMSIRFGYKVKELIEFLESFGYVIKEFDSSQFLAKKY